MTDRCHICDEIAALAARYAILADQAERGVEHAAPEQREALRARARAMRENAEQTRIELARHQATPHE